MKPSHRTWVIGIDGGTFAIFDPLIEMGMMPTLAKLKQDGAWGDLMSTVPPFTGAAWSSFSTGVNPGQHGIINFTERDRYNYDILGSGFVNSQKLPITLWEMLSQQEKHVGVMNVPMSYPPRAVNGFMVTGMLTPPGSLNYTYPPEFRHQLDSTYMIDVDFIREGDTFRRYGMPPKAEMLRQITTMTEERIKACSKLLPQHELDFFMVVITGTDRVFHFFWDDLQALIAGETDSELSQALLAYFKIVDNGVQTIMELADEETTFFIMSDHGFGTAPNRRFYVNVWLEKLGLLTPPAGKGLFDLAQWRMKIGRVPWLKALLRKLISQQAQDAVSNVADSGSQAQFDWRKTKAYFVPIYFHVCGVELNVAGERREGVVLEDDYDALCQTIINEAKQLVDPLTGENIVHIAARRDTLFSGDEVESFPDIIIVLNPDYVGAGSLAGSLLFEPHPDPFRPGEHRDEGVFLATGPAIEAKGALPDLHIMDVPATVLYSMGLPVPVHFNGRILTELYSPEHLAAQPPEETEQFNDFASYRQTTDIYSDAEEDELVERLRGLGYME